MSETQETGPGEAATVDLGERLDITVVGTARDTLAERVAGGQPIELDGTRLEHVDSAGLQLLLAFMQAAPGLWTWRGGEPPDCVAEAARELGLPDGSNSTEMHD